MNKKSHIPCFFFAMLGVGILLSTPANAMATDTLTFNSAVLPPTPFMLRISKAQGVTVRQGETGVKLSARVIKPDRDGPFPVVVMLPTCKGWSGMGHDWTYRIVQWGYAVVHINSIQSRPDIKINCDPARYNGIVGGTDLLFDGMGALDYLSQSAEFDVDRAVVMGWGLGGAGAIKSVNAQGFARLFPFRFKAAIAFYPNCEMHSEYLAPSLVFIGSDDTLSRPLLCQTMLDNTPLEQKHLFTLRIIENRVHEFDQKEDFSLDQVPEIRQEIEGFLKQHIGQ